SSDPMISLMQSEGLVKIVADTRTPEGTQAVYGGPYPGGVVYTTADFIAKNPRTVQAIVTAFVRALKWMSAHAAEDVAKAVPPEYALGNREVYVKALAASKRCTRRMAASFQVRSRPRTRCLRCSILRSRAQRSIYRRLTPAPSWRRRLRRISERQCARL